VLRLDELPVPGTGDRRVRLGVDEAELRPVPVDLLDADQHLIVLGDAGSGRSNLLRLVVRDLTSRLTDDEVVFAVVDTRRTLLDVVPEDYLGAFAGTVTAAGGWPPPSPASCARGCPATT
jgi:S-DNA-T family DNA segregation ATPase FtsK/SpoIIIE